MSADLVERALREERPLEPSAGFAERVMRAVRLEADGEQAIAFPWSRLAPGLAACAVLTVLGLAALASRGAPPPDAIGTMSEGLERAGLAAGAAWLSMALSGTWVLVWGASRVAGGRR